MVKNVPSVVLDTNILISGLFFGGNPKEILELIKARKISAATSPVLLAELGDVLSKKFKYPQVRVQQVEKKLKQWCQVVYPEETIGIVRDDDDNRVLEAALAGGCDYLVTGDEDLLDLKKYKNIKILTPNEFIEMV
jgi:putative PIN family toxin of toxin-antitoxin system